MSKFYQLPSFNTTEDNDSSSVPLHVGRRVLITGGASGIGRQVAMRYVQQGAKVVVGDLNIAGCKETVRLCGNPANGGECFTPAESCDVTSKASTTSLFTFATTVFAGQPPDIVIANAGVNEVGHLEDDVVLHNEYGPYPEKPVQVTLDVNLSGAILTAEVARRVWKVATSETGHEVGRQRKLVLISSMGGWEGIPMGTLYSMAKHGILGYWVALAAEQERLKDTTFSCHAICPFFAATAILDTAILLALAGIPKTTPEDIARAIEVVGRDTPTGAQSEHTAVLLPDDKTPLVIQASEFDPLSGEMYADLASIVNRRQPQADDAGYRSTTWPDIKQALAHNKQASSLKPLLGAAMAAIAVNTLARQLSVFQNLAFGFLAAAATSYLTPNAKARAEAVKA